MPAVADTDAKRAGEPSLTGLTELREILKDEIRAVLERNMSNGILRIPKEYGLFAAK